MDAMKIKMTSHTLPNFLMMSITIGTALTSDAQFACSLYPRNMCRKNKNIKVLSIINAYIMHGKQLSLESFDVLPLQLQTRNI